MPATLDSRSWKTIRGQFISIIGANITCRCAKSLDGISPNAHLGDGLFDLILIRKTSRMQYLRHMMRIANRGDLVGVQLLIFSLIAVSLNSNGFHVRGANPFGLSSKLSVKMG